MNKVVQCIMMILLITCILPVKEALADASELHPMFYLDEERIDYSEFSKDDSKVLTVSADGVKIFSTSNGKKLANVFTGNNVVKAMFSKDEKEIYVFHNVKSEISSQYSGLTLSVIESKSGEIKTELLLNQHEVQSARNVILSDDEKRLYIQYFNDVMIYDLANRQEVTTVKYTEYLDGIVYNEQKNELVVMFQEYFNILDGTTGAYKTNQAVSVTSHMGMGYDLIKNGQELMMKNRYSSIVLFDANNEYKQMTLKDNEYEGLIGFFQEIEGSHNGEYVVAYETGDYGDYLKLFDANNRNVIVQQRVSFYDLQNIKFSHNDQMLLVNNVLYDLSFLEGLKLDYIQIMENFGVLNVEDYAEFNVAAILKNGDWAYIDYQDIKWTISDQSILEPYYQSFYGSREGIAYLTASYNGFEDTIPVAVVKPFSDIDPDDESYDAIHYLRTLGVINGHSDYHFAPNEKISRQHLSAMITRSPLELLDVRADRIFNDVDYSNPFKGNIDKLYRAGILDGSTNGGFLPYNNITKIEMAKILSNLFKLERFSINDYEFYDLASNHWGHTYAENVVATGIMPETTYFNPNSYVTRSEFAQYFYNGLILMYYNPE